MNVEDYTSLDHFAYDQVDMAPHVRTLTRLAREATTVIEWGVRAGVSTWAILDGIPDDGHLYSVDINPCIVPRRVSEDPRWTFIVGDDLSDEVHDQLPERADMVFIDTSHTYEQTVAELVLADFYEPARIVMHDFVMEPVERAAREFCEMYGWHVVANELPFGLATLEPA